MKKKIVFNIQLFSNKLISLDRMKDFLGGCKNTFFMETDHLVNDEITTLVDNIMNPKYNYDGVYGQIPDLETGMVDLSYYARDYIPNYTRITQIPQENLDYLNSGLVTSNMEALFGACYKLEYIPKLNIDTSKCYNISWVFSACISLPLVDLSNFDTSNITNMSYMFYNCNTLLTTIKGIIDMKSCTNYNNMFGLCPNISGVKIKNPPQLYYDDKEQFESTIGLSSDQYEIVS